MKQKRLLSISLLAGLCLMIGCTITNRERDANKAFYDRLYADAIEDYKSLVDEKFEKKDKSYIIYLLNYALINYYAGYFEEARKSFWAAYQVGEGKIPSATKAFQWLMPEHERIYRLTKRETALLHFYLGMSYLLSESIDDALIEFKKIRLIEEQEPKIPLLSFYMGKAYEIAGEYDDAVVEYRTLNELAVDQSQSIAYLELTKAYHLKGETKQSIEYAQKFSSFMGSADSSVNVDSLAPDNSYELIVQIDQDIMIDRCVIYADEEYIGEAQLYDRFDPGFTIGEGVREVIKETTSYAARKGIGYFFRKLFWGEADSIELKEIEKSDERSWYYAPKGFSLFVGFIPKDTELVSIDFFVPDIPFLRSGSERVGGVTYDLSSTPCVALGDHVFLTVRYQSKPYGTLRE